VTRKISFSRHGLPAKLSQAAFARLAAAPNLAKHHLYWQDGRPLLRIIQEVNDWLKFNGHNDEMEEVRDRLWAMWKAEKAEKERATVEKNMTPISEAPEVPEEHERLETLETLDTLEPLEEPVIKVEAACVRVASQAAVPSSFRPLGTGFYRQGHSIWELRAAEDEEGGYILTRKHEERAVDMRKQSSTAHRRSAADLLKSLESWVAPVKSFAPVYMGGEVRIDATDRDALYRVDGFFPAAPDMDQIYAVPNPILVDQDTVPGDGSYTNHRVKLRSSTKPEQLIFVSVPELEQNFTSYQPHGKVKPSYGPQPRRDRPKRENINPNKPHYSQEITLLSPPTDYSTAPTQDLSEDPTLDIPRSSTPEADQIFRDIHERRRPTQDQTLDQRARQPAVPKS